MDEQKLAELFRAAAADAPPSSFDAHDVTRVSRRITARRRSMLAGGSAVAGIVLVVGLVVGFVGFGHTGSSSSRTAASAPVAGANPGASSDFDRAQPMIPRVGSGFSTTTPKQGGDVDGGTGSNPAGCGPTDVKLAVALANELPSVGATQVPADSAVPLPAGCPAGARSAGFLVRDSSGAGLVGVVLLPAGVPPTQLTLPARTASRLAPTAAGAVVVAFSQPVASSATAPLADRLGVIAAAVAAHA